MCLEQNSHEINFTRHPPSVRDRYGDIASVSLFIRKTYISKHACSLNGSEKIISTQHKMTLFILVNGVVKIFLPSSQSCKHLQLFAFRLQGT